VLTPSTAVPAGSRPVLVPIPADVVELAEAPFFGDLLGRLAVAYIEEERSVWMDEHIDAGSNKDGRTTNLDIKLEVLGITSDARLAAWDVLDEGRFVSFAFLSRLLLLF
jgi:hypothetical protein